VQAERAKRTTGRKVLMGASLSGIFGREEALEALLHRDVAVELDAELRLLAELRLARAAHDARVEGAVDAVEVEGDPDVAHERAGDPQERAADAHVQHFAVELLAGILDDDLRLEFDGKARVQPP